MRWRGRRGSANIEDRRGRARRGGLGRARLGGRRGGGTARLGGFGLVAVLALGWFLGVDVTPLLTGGGVPVQTVQTGAPAGGRAITEAEQQQARFVSVVLADTEEVWGDVFREQVGRPYDEPTLVLYSGVTASPCGGASGATGPFYCPADESIYLDTAFFTTLERDLGARGDFAAAYVVAHESAHHVQNELGILGEANRARARATPEESNAISVRLELQADCYSGIWARRAQEDLGVLEPGDLDEALAAARRIGDDHLAERAGRTPMPHTFTHGTSEQRSRWFARGWEAGELSECDTFGAGRL